MAELSTIEIGGTEIELVDAQAREGLSGKVDKEEGKALSSNDYTAAEKAKLAATPAFWKGTQAEYDALESHDPSTLYWIVEAG